MKLRPYAAVVATLATAAFSLSVVAPAGAAATDPVTGLAVTQAQVGHDLRITATWTANPDATTYRAYLSDASDGSGPVLAFKDTSGTSATLSTSALASGQTYWIAVKAIGPAAGDVTTAGFSAITLDETGPSGTYSLDRRSAYRGYDATSAFDAPASASFRITQTSLTDDTSLPAAITRRVIPGDGSASQAWTGGTFTLRYTATGTFTPRVSLTDQFGNSTVVSLPSITAKDDSTKPRVRITVPAKPTKVASWKRIKGTATDTGSGVDVAMAFVVQQRGKIWYSYDFETRKWLKGYTSRDKTVGLSDAFPAIVKPTATGTWRTPAIAGLRKGKLHVEAVAFDKTSNIGMAPDVNRTLK